MPEENKAVIRRYIEEVFNQGNLSVVEEFVTDGYIDHDPVNPGARGPDGVRSIAKKYRDAFPDMHMKIDDLLAVDDKVIARWTSTGTHEGELDGMPPTGKHVTITGMSISRFEGGRIAEAWPIFDALGLLRQLGVLPSP